MAAATRTNGRPPRVYVCVEGRIGEEGVGRYKLHRAVDEARSKLGKLSSPCIGAVPGYTPL